MMAYFIPADKYGREVMYRLQKEGHGRVVDDRTTSDPASAIVDFLLNLLVRLVTRIVDRALAKVKQWQDIREFERIKKRQAQYRAEYRKKS
jgi:hypothetical protein